MEIADANGRHLGTVDEIDGDTIKLTRSDSSDSRHHYVPFESVDRIEDNRVYLKDGAAAPEARESLGVQQQAGAAQQQQFGGEKIDPTTYSSHRPTVHTAIDTPLFTGPSGTGGSGAGH
ncbi:MAG: DUF2171 domain-containing protein [Sphingobium sp.]